MNFFLFSGPTDPNRIWIDPSCIVAVLVLSNGREIMVHDHCPDNGREVVRAIEPAKRRVGLHYSQHATAGR